MDQTSSGRATVVSVGVARENHPAFLAVSVIVTRVSPGKAGSSDQRATISAISSLWWKSQAPSTDFVADFGRNVRASPATFRATVLVASRHIGVVWRSRGSDSGSKCLGSDTSVPGSGAGAVAEYRKV